MPMFNFVVSQYNSKRVGMIAIKPFKFFGTSDCEAGNSHVPILSMKPITVLRMQRLINHNGANRSIIITRLIVCMWILGRMAPIAVYGTMALSNIPEIAGEIITLTSLLCWLIIYFLKKLLSMQCQLNVLVLFRRLYYTFLATLMQEKSACNANPGPNKNPIAYWHSATYK